MEVYTFSRADIIFGEIAMLNCQIVNVIATMLPLFVVNLLFFMKWRVYSKRMSTILFIIRIKIN